VPALDPKTPIFASSFTMALIKRRMMEFGLWDPERFKLFELGKDKRWQAGPFEVEAVRVTHSIPDCCGLFFRCSDGTIVHTGDWKIDEQPMDGEEFDRAAFEEIGREGVTLFMSDSTNVLSPGRTTSESLVAQSLLHRVGNWNNGRIIATCFASNIHRLEALKAAADSSGRKLVLMGMSLSVYLEAAFKDGRATFSPAQLVDAEEMDGWDPNKLLIVTTGSQAEPRAMLSRAAYNGAKNLRLTAGDLLIYSAKMIPGNEKRVMKMLNAIAQRGPELAVGRGEVLHSSGHAHRDELTEVLRLVRPQHFLPVHGEYAFLKMHEELGRASGVRHTAVIQNGQMLGCGQLRSGNSHGRLGTFQLLGEAKLQNMYNDGGNGSGTRDDLALEDRKKLANEGLVVAVVRIYRDAGDVAAAVAAGYIEGKRGDDPEREAREDDERNWREAGRPSDARRGGRSGAASSSEERGYGGGAGPRLRGDVKLTLRALYTFAGAHQLELQAACEAAIAACSAAAPSWEVERAVRKAVMTNVRRLMQRKPEIIVNAFEASNAVDSGEEARKVSAATRRGLVRRAAADAEPTAGPAGSR
jgi:beta-CASP RNase J family ribonuclease